MNQLNCTFMAWGDGPSKRACLSSEAAASIPEEMSQLPHSFPSIALGVIAPKKCLHVLVH